MGLSLARLIPLVYDQLRLIARWQRADCDDGTLSTTDFVHEACLKPADQSNPRTSGVSG